MVDEESLTLAQSHIPAVLVGIRCIVMDPSNYVDERERIWILHEPPKYRLPQDDFKKRAGDARALALNAALRPIDHSSQWLHYQVAQ
jgi:hypothetical protein